MPLTPKQAREKPSAKPSARRAPVPQKHGGALVPGAGGGPQPGSGRPSNSFKDFLAELRAAPDTRAALKAAASDSACRNFGNAWKLIGEYDEEKPAKKQDIAAKVTVTLEYTEADE